MSSQPPTIPLTSSKKRRTNPTYAPSWRQELQHPPPARGSGNIIIISNGDSGRLSSSGSGQASTTPSNVTYIPRNGSSTKKPRQRRLTRAFFPSSTSQIDHFVPPAAPALQGDRFHPSHSTPSTGSHLPAPAFADSSSSAASGLYENEWEDAGLPFDHENTRGWTEEDVVRAEIQTRLGAPTTSRIQLHMGDFYEMNRAPPTARVYSNSRQAKADGWSIETLPRLMKAYHDCQAQTRHGVTKDVVEPPCTCKQAKTLTEVHAVDEDGEQ